ncbi:protein of unknown function [Taphrina deformans PYCC 5710]|uniref:Anaphase-promoting complex subunit 2 n=1 Tax=Taphrina deformans (strain PYCC 5710 / ATCC 11124 / CBS 356.35 / IMI 108563 / JCM 9778 / NBRC 8474) TaxID=1097556 RepID=R4XGP1_TAPDE|nr:protein of unknown function [Taphrina deformans PYCC 5710]|eukprot:CCG84833.1 protein of unknown function [Taphrina deformans PYCC 5710]
MRTISRRNIIQRASTIYEIDHNTIHDWHFIQAYLKTSNAREGSQHELDTAMSTLSPDLVLQSYIELIRTTFEQKIVPALNSVEPSVHNLRGIITNLSEGLKRYEACFQRLQVSVGGISEPFKALVRAQISGSRWTRAIHDWIDAELNSEQDSYLEEVFGMTERIGLREIFVLEFQVVLRSHLTNSIRKEFANEWSESALPLLTTTMMERPRRLLTLIRMPITEEQIQSLPEQGLAKLRIDELFDIIVDFPSSGAALEDLKQCLRSTEMRAELVRKFKQQCQMRLLHPGANTPDIITVYISTIRAFLILDPPGVLLDKVARPLRKYLRERSDTIRCIISSLLGEVDGELSLELSEQQLPEEVNDEDDPLWLPDPIDAAPDYAKNRASDIIGSLISIYENKDVFARELQTLLADRLLAVTDHNIDQELRNLELLKVRFGDGMLSVCDVMLKDMSNSRRVDLAVHEPRDGVANAEGLDRVIHTTIVSRLYWPNLKSNTYEPQASAEGAVPEQGFRLPAHLAGLLSDYSAEYSKLKAQRSLIFQKDLGHVRVEIELEDRTLDMMVTPAHAASVLLFGEQSSLLLADISTSLNLSESETRRNLAFWVKQGVLSVNDHRYTVLEVSTSGSGSNHLPMMEEVVPDVVEEVDEMSMYWNFIVGMLTNVGSLQPERIHSMLGMFAPSYDKSLNQLKLFLQRKTRDGGVELSGGLYKLPAS